MKNKKSITVLLLAFIALALSACSSRPIANNWPGLAADAERAYLATGSFVYAVDLATGKEAWRYPAETGNEYVFYAAPVLTEDGQLLIGSVGTAHALLSLDPATGKENWTEPFTGAKGTWLASPLVWNGAIYAPNTDGFLYILDLTGRQSADPIQLGGALWSAPVTDGELIYITSLDHHLHIVDPATLSSGEPVELGGASPSSPVVAENGVYAGSFASEIEFISPVGDHVVVATAEDWVWGTPAFDAGTLYYADLSGNVYSFDIASKTQNWTNLKPNGPVAASPLVMGDRIYFVAEDGILLALDRDGKTVWEKEIGGKIYTSPVSSGELIIVAPYQADFLLAAYDTEGKQAWTFATGETSK